MTDDTRTTTRQLLSGKTNYLGWAKVMNANLSIKTLIVKGVLQPGKDEEASNIILTLIALKIAGDLPDDDWLLKMLDWLKSRYGDDNRWDAESDLKNLTMLGIDPSAFLPIARTKSGTAKSARLRSWQSWELTTLSTIERDILVIDRIRILKSRMLLLNNDESVNRRWEMVPQFK